MRPNRLILLLLLGVVASMRPGAAEAGSREIVIRETPVPAAQGVLEIPQSCDPLTATCHPPEPEWRVESIRYSESPARDSKESAREHARVRKSAADDDDDDDESRGDSLERSDADDDRWRVVIAAPGREAARPLRSAPGPASAYLPPPAGRAGNSPHDRSAPPGRDGPFSPR